MAGSCSGAYCAMTLVSLLDLPLTLPPDAEAREAGLETFASGLAEYLSRCRCLYACLLNEPC